MNCYDFTGPGHRDHLATLMRMAESLSKKSPWERWSDKWLPWRLTADDWLLAAENSILVEPRP